MEHDSMHDWDTDGFPGEFVYGDELYVDDCYMEERWKPLDPFLKYWVSDRERVWSNLTRKFLKLKRADKAGHLGICRNYDGVQKYDYIHRLMAKAFIPNPNNLPVVRHLNDNPADNELDNLAWGTQRENAFDSIRNGTAYMLTDEDREKGFQKKRKPIIAVCLNSGKETYFRGQSEASRALNIQQANIWKVLNGERAYAGGYSFRYVKQDGERND